MENQKNNKGVIVLLIVIIVILSALCIVLTIGTIGFKFGNVTNNTSENKDITSDIINNDDVNDGNISGNNDDKEDNNSSYNIELYSKKMGEYLNFKLNIVDGKLNAVLGKEIIAVNGINGKIKSLLHGYDCGGTHYFLALTTDNKIYYFDAYDTSFADDVNHVNFIEILSDKNVINITKIQYAGYRTCGGHDFAVVLDNNEIRAIYYDNDNFKFNIGELDYSQIKFSRMGIVLYNDNTISEVLAEPYDGPIGNKISYNNENLILEKYIYFYNSNSSYVISKNKLYKLTWKYRDENSAVEVVDKIELVNNSKIDTESLNVMAGENYYWNDKKSNTIKFTDGSYFEITNILGVYSVK